MPPLDEGVLLYMPTTLPGISVTEAQRLMQVQDRILTRFPEVRPVLGKAGRAETSTDPAPLSMVETVISSSRRPNGARSTPGTRPGRRSGSRPCSAHITPDHISTGQLVDEMNQAVALPGVSNAWTMPIKNRVDMLTTGIRTPVGIKIYGLGHQDHRADRRRRSRRCCRRCRARAAFSRSAPAAAISWISIGSATSWRATA